MLGAWCLVFGVIVPNFIIIYKIGFTWRSGLSRLMNNFSPAIPLRGTVGDGPQEELMAFQKTFQQPVSRTRN